MKNYPTTQDLKKNWWFRAGIILKWIILFLALLSPEFTPHKGVWYLDGVVNAIMWYFVLLLVWKLIKYVVYGTMPNQQIFKKESQAKTNEIILIVSIVVAYFFIFFLLKTSHSLIFI